MTKSQSQPKVLVCRTAWMERYEGIVAGERPAGGGGYVDENGFGHEIFNFLKDPHDGRYRGYVRPPCPKGTPVADQRLNIDRLGARKTDPSVSGVTVFWAATKPTVRGTHVVGWYDDATVHRSWQPSPRKRLLPNKQDAGFMIEAPRARLLAIDDRTFQLPRADEEHTGIGQSNVWYPPAEWAAKLLDLRAEVLAGDESTTPVFFPGRMQDVEKRQRIELAAMEATAAWCERRKYAWRDVSAENLGWDILATTGQNTELRIEVKGTSRSLDEAVVELTPNEYAMLGQHRDAYRIAVVSVSETERRLVMFSWSGEANQWVGDCGHFRLDLTEIVSARAAIRAATHTARR